MITVAWESFTPWSSFFGGIVIGIAAALFILFNGRVAGISGIIAGILRPIPHDLYWRITFIAGMMSAAVLWKLFGSMPSINIEADTPTLIVAGLLVGLGTRYGSGCTSGHGVCGLSRMSPRSLVATLSFMGAGFVTVYVIRHLIGA